MLLEVVVVVLLFLVVGVMVRVMVHGRSSHTETPHHC